MLNRFVIPTIEGRIFTGITMFVAVMILIGWVAINEPGRMESFSKQHEGRSIERGAELFAANCSTCHGTDGLGQQNRGPALNNPMLFGHNYLEENNEVILKQERQLDELNAELTKLEDERTALTTEAGGETLTDARREEITARLAEIDVLTGVEGETALGAQIAKIQADLVPLYEARDQVIDGWTNAINAGYMPGLEAARTEGGSQFTNYLNQDASRLAQVGWGSDVPNYLRTTLIHGRPGSNNVWPAPMVAWSQRAGGPLRDDQIDDIVAFIMNYDKGNAWTLEDLLAVKQFPKLHGGAPEGTGIPPVGNDTDAALTIIEAMVGDPVRGDALYHAQERTELRQNLACASCHVNQVQGPNTEGTWDRVVSERITQAELAGYTPEHYIVESILQPSAYVVPGFNDVMPHELGLTMSAKDLADLVAYLHSTSPDYVAPDPSTITPLTSPNTPQGGAADSAAETGMDSVPEGGEDTGSVQSPSGESVPPAGNPPSLATAEAAPESTTAPEGTQPEFPTAQPTNSN